jgi:hypothetical protein
MRITDKVKIGGFIYDVKRPPESFVSNSGVALDGEHCFSEKRISVAERGCMAYQELVFLHEICHAIIDTYISSAEKDERFVEAFSKGLYQVIVDNPDIFTFDKQRKEDGK